MKYRLRKNPPVKGNITQLKPGCYNYKVTLPTRKGTFDIIVIANGEYDGVDVEFIPENEQSEEIISNPRVLFEFNGEDASTLRAVAWTDPHKEDYTREISFPVFVPFRSKEEKHE